MIKTRVISIITLFIFVSSFVVAPLAQSTSSDSQTGDEPLPYQPDEFPGWTEDLRRAEILALGSYPISFLLTSSAFGIYRLITPAYSGDIKLAPGDISQDRYTALFVSIGLSLTIALTDFILGKIFDEGT